MIHRDNEAQGKTNRRVAMFNGKRLSGWMALAVFATVGGAMVAAAPAFAKTDVDKLTISGEIRERYEIRNNAGFGTNRGGNPSASNSNLSIASHRVRVGVGYDLTPDVSFFAQIADGRTFGSEGAAGNTAVTNAGGGANGIDLHQGYIQLKNVLIPGLSLKAGRQEIMFGDHRLLGNFGWSQNGNAFDGVRLTQSGQAADVDLFWIRTVDSCSTGAVGNALNCASSGAAPFPGGAAAGTAGTSGTFGTRNQDLYGLYVTLKPVKNWTIEPYYILLADSRAANPNQIGTGAAATAITTAQYTNQSRNFLGGRINGNAGVAGMKWDFTYEGNYQFGGAMSNCQRASGTVAACGRNDANTSSAAGLASGHDLRINATQQVVKTGLTFENVPMKPRLGFEFDYASGDRCANGVADAGRGSNNNACSSQNHRQTGLADNLFPTNHFHYGYMDMMAWKNMVNYQIMFDVKPSPVSKLQFNYTIHRLARTADNWYRGNQAVYAVSTTTNQEASLGQELNVHYWHTFKEKFKFEIGYGHFFAGAYLDKSANSNTNGPQGGFAGASTINGTANAALSQTTVVGQDWGYLMGSILF